MQSSAQTRSSTPHGKRAPKPRTSKRKTAPTAEAVYTVDDLWAMLQAGCFERGFDGVTEQQFEAALRTLHV